MTALGKKQLRVRMARAVSKVTDQFTDCGGCLEPWCDTIGNLDHGRVRIDRARRPHRETVPQLATSPDQPSAGIVGCNRAKAVLFYEDQLGDKRGPEESGPIEPCRNLDLPCRPDEKYAPRPYGTTDPLFVASCVSRLGESARGTCKHEEVGHVRGCHVGCPGCTQ